MVKLGSLIVVAAVTVLNQEESAKSSVMSTLSFLFPDQATGEIYRRTRFLGKWRDMMRDKTLIIILSRVELNIRRVQIKAERISANYYLTDVQTVV